MHRLLVLLLLLHAAWSTTAQEDPVAPVALVGDALADSVEAGNAAIAAQATAAVAAGQPTIFLVSFRTPEEAVTSQAQAISTAAGLDQVTTKTVHQARRHVFADVKARVLGPAVAAAAAAAANTEALTTEAGPAQAPPPSIQIIKDRRNLPITTVSISSAEQLAQLRAHPGVLSVVPDGYLTVASTAAWEHIGQPAVAAKGFIGSGTVVIIDTGIDYRKPAFGPCTAPGVPAATCKVVYMEDMVTDDRQLDFDPSAPDHGTNVAGIVASVAPGAKLIGLDVFDNGRASFNPIADAVDWSIENKDKFNITIINMSLGGSKATSACDDHVVAVALNEAYNFGIMTVTAAGNSGDKTSVMIPACASKAVAVGAVYSTTASRVAYAKCTDTDVVPDKVTCFSNSSPKVALLAPGHDVEAAGITKSGTSQASPIVAGAIAVVRSRYPSYSLTQVLELLQKTGTPVKDPVNGLVIPRLNLRAAMGMNCVPKLSPAFIRAANTGGSYTLTVTPATADCKWTVAAPSETWMRITSAASGTGPGTVTLQVDPVSGTAARATGLSVNADSAATILVSQAVVASSVVDTKSPTMGRLKATPAATYVDLTWPVAQDAQSGVSTYKVVYNKDSRPPRPRCTTGTAVNQQAQASGSEMKMRVGLAAKTMYTFRVCAIDAAGNVAFGAVWRGSTQ